MSSKINSKGKIFFLWAFLCLVLLVNRSTTELNNYQLTQIVTKLEKQLNSEKVHFDETITALKNQFKIKLVQLKNEAKSNFNQTMNTVNTLSTTVERLDKISKVAISCFELAQKGNLESNFYLLDTDGHQGVQSPFQGFCQFPEGLTIIGNDVSFDFDHCNESFCSEHLIDYKDPTTGQLATLLEAATSCEQTITFDCFLSPIKDITGEFYLQWMDRHGSYHNVTSLGENNCNRNWPKLLSDSAVLDDRTLLPVTGVRYGPMRFQLQKAKISVTKLQCQPYSSLSRFKCYTDSKYYKLVNGICYYYEKAQMHYRGAQHNCRLIMGPNGHLAEPQTAEEHDQITKDAKIALGPYGSIWIGVDQIGRNGSGSFLYSSTRTKPTVIGRGYETNLNSANTNAQDAYCAMLKRSNSGSNYGSNFGRNNYQVSQSINLQVSQSNCGQKMYSVCQAKYL